MTTLHTVIETKSFGKDADKVLTQEERDTVTFTLASDPTHGVLLDAGLRKMRVATGGKGKSGGARVVYYFTGGNGEVYLIALFAKNEKDNLTKAELKAIAEMVKSL